MVAIRSDAGSASASQRRLRALAVALRNALKPIQTTERVPCAAYRVPRAAFSQTARDVSFRLGIFEQSILDQSGGLRNGARAWCDSHPLVEQ